MANTLWQPVSQTPTTGKPKNFLDALQVWIRKPHVVNRRLCGALIHGQYSYTGTVLEYDTIKQLVNHADKLSDGKQFAEDLHQLLGASLCPADVTLEKADSEETNGFQIYLRDLIPKSSDKHPTLREVVIIDPIACSGTFLPALIIKPDQSTLAIEGDLGYKIHLDSQEQSVHLTVLGSRSAYDPEGGHTPLGYTLTWLADTLLPKLAHWSEETSLNTAITSLKLVPMDAYNQKYLELKHKYGYHLVKIWPEKTDPQKFVYEDVAIAAYLLVLWECERAERHSEQRQSFVDLGCGNGLLVYILSKEGHRGLGLDVRKRNIWDMYGEGVMLKEMAVMPSDANLFPEYDWLIGNHSDELTPWIPVMAAKSSYQSSYFVLPCCAWDFRSRYNNKSAGMSQYRCYLDYVRTVGEVCGFSVLEDTLRIPSTKRVCFIGKTRTYEAGNEANIFTQIQNFIDERTEKQNKASKKHESNTAVHSRSQDNRVDLGPSVKESVEGSSNAYSDSSQDNQNKNIQLSKECSDPHENENSVPCHREKLANSEMERTSHPEISKGDVPKSNVSPVAKKARMLSASDYDVFRQENDPDILPKESIRTETNSLDKASPSKEWVLGFQARAPEEKIQNCVGVAQGVRDHIIQTVFQAVLDRDPPTGSGIVVLDGGKEWKKGGEIALSDVALMFDCDTLSNLKSQCGGMQTLLRNCHHVFRVQGGLVSLRDWTSDDYATYQHKKKTKRKYKPKAKAGDTPRPTKTRLCYFHLNHPNGCPLTSEVCTYAHGEHELQTVKPA